VQTGSDRNDSLLDPTLDPDSMYDGYEGIDSSSFLGRSFSNRERCQAACLMRHTPGPGQQINVSVLELLALGPAAEATPSVYEFISAVLLSSES